VLPPTAAKSAGKWRHRRSELWGPDTQGAGPCAPRGSRGRAGVLCFHVELAVTLAVYGPGWGRGTCSKLQ